MSTNYIDQITDTAGTTHDVQEATDIRIFRATCSTAAGTAAKVATLSDPKGFSLTTGVKVAVTFQYTNTQATPTLRVDGTSTGTAKTIATFSGSSSVLTSGGATYYTWAPGETVIFTYSGTYWIRDGGAAVYKAYNLADGKTSNTGTVTSIGISNATNGGLSVSGSPVTSSGTITIGLASAYGDTKNPYGSKTANYVLAAPNGSAGVPSFRALVAADIPDLSGTYVPVTQTGDANTRLEPTTTITIDPKNNGDVIQCTSTETTNFSSMSFGPYGAFIQAGTPSEMGMNIRGGIGVGVSYHVVDLSGNDDNNGYDNVYCQGGEVGLQSFNTDYTSGTQTIITPSAFNIIHATDSSNSSLFNIDTTSGVFNVPLNVNGKISATNYPVYTAGSTYTQTDKGIIPCAGLVTSSTTAVYFTYVLPGAIDTSNVSSISVTTLTGSMRGPSGYVNSTTDTSNLLSGYTVTADIMDLNKVRIIITKSSAMSNVTNNQPVTVSVRTLGLSFS